MFWKILTNKIFHYDRPLILSTENSNSFNPKQNYIKTTINLLKKIIKNFNRTSKLSTQTHTLNFSYEMRRCTFLHRSPTMQKKSPLGAFYCLYTHTHAPRYKFEIRRCLNMQMSGAKKGFEEFTESNIRFMRCTINTSS